MSRVVGRKEGVELPVYVAVEAATAVLDIAPSTALLPRYSAPASDLEFVLALAGESI